MEWRFVPSPSPTHEIEMSQVKRLLHTLKLVTSKVRFMNMAKPLEL